MPRRGENIYKRKDGRWEGRYIIDYDISGKARYKYLYAKNYREIKDKIHSEKGRNSCTKSVRNGEDILFADLLNEWANNKKMTVKESTYAKYRYNISHYILPTLGNLKLGNITMQKINVFLCKTLFEKQSLSNKTISDVFSLIKNSLLYAKNCGVNIDFNIEKAKIKGQKKEMRVLSVSEQSVLTRFLLENTDRCKFGVLLCMYTGMRIGELCALKWKNVNCEERKIIIAGTAQRIFDNSLSKNKTKVIISPPKTVSSVREIPIPDCLLNTATAFRQDGECFVLSGCPDKITEPRIVQYRFKQYLQKCKIDDANFHSLRHTFATRCIESGVDIKSLSEILGHSDVSVTLNKYVHSSFELKAANINKLTFFT